MYGSPTNPAAVDSCHNGHVVLYLHARTLGAKAARRWMQYEFYRQWHADELEHSRMHQTPPQQSDEQTALINQITDLAIRINLTMQMTVDLKYNGRAHQLHVTAQHQGCSRVDEHIDLTTPGDSEFSTRRTNNRLRETVRTLTAISLRPQPIPPAAA